MKKRLGMGLSVEQMAQGVLQGDRVVLAQAITLIESHKKEHWPKAKELLNRVYDAKKKSPRIGFSGAPGVGKSSLVESLGLELIKGGGSVAVLAVDPSSSISGGSVLGDRTRMEKLSSHPRAFIRPSPSRGHLGGVTSVLAGVLVLCEASGFDWILVESVGVGQSEVELRFMVDRFTLIVSPGAGDDLQGIKKGILEYVDQVVVNKNDWDSSLVHQTQQHYRAALNILRGKEKVPIKSCSALKGHGVQELSQDYREYFKDFSFSRRWESMEFWLKSLLISRFQQELSQRGDWQIQIQEICEKVRLGQGLCLDWVDQFLSELGGPPQSSPS